MISEMNDGRLKAAFTKVPEGSKPRSDCPPPDRLWQAVRGELAPAELKTVVLHLGDCPVCTESWQLAEMLEKEADEEEKTAPNKTRGPSLRRMLGLGAAAALSASIGLSLLLRPSVTPTPLPGPSDTFRAPESSNVQEIELISGELLFRDDFHLMWTGPTDNEILYRLQIIPVGSMESLIDIRDLSAREYRVAPEVFQGIPPSAKLSVLIEARHPFKGRLAGPTFSVTVQ